MSVAVTNGIRVAVATRYLEAQSNPQQDHYVFTYEITISNQGKEAVQLLSRHWIIQDANNNIEEIEGEGVIGKTPIIPPKDSFTYSSFCPLRTEWGIMKGSYQMQTENGEEFEAAIAPFALMMPHLLN